jgi:3-hydroxyacyl-[acyl-carrier-protein] dehydratase
MPALDPHVDLASIDFTKQVADIHALRGILPHRFEFEMLTAIVSIDPVNHVVVGYKDVTPDEFWARGHFPNHPLMPGVLMCEAAAQICAYYTLQLKVVQGMLMGLGGIENARFRKAVRPGDRLVLLGKGTRVRPRMTVFNVQGYVGENLAFHTDVIGLPLGRWEDLEGA